MSSVAAISAYKPISAGSSQTAIAKVNSARNPTLATRSNEFAVTITAGLRDGAAKNPELAT
jgi:hypothetical protein